MLVGSPHPWHTHPAHGCSHFMGTADAESQFWFFQGSRVMVAVSPANISTTLLLNLPPPPGGCWQKLNVPAVRGDTKPEVSYRH